MKQIIKTLAVIAAAFAMASCSKDNYEAPKETFKGAFIDKATGEAVQVAPGASINDGGIRIRMMEYSWSDNPTPYDFFAKQDGTFQNTKIFKGTYGVIPEGPFVPLEEIRLDINGVVEHTFEVEPFLRVEWVGEPKQLSDGTVEVKVKITRGTDNPEYQKPLNDAWLYVNQTTYVGNSSHSGLLSTYISKDELSSYNFGDVLTVRTGYPNGFNGGAGDANKFPSISDRPYFFRFAACTESANSGVKRYNFTPVEEFTVSVK